MGQVVTPKPGDFAVVQLNGPVGKLISLGELLNGSDFGLYDHALLCLSSTQYLEAEPGGARIVSMPVPYTVIMWSTGIIPLSPAQRKRICLAGQKYAGTKYSWLDYLALAAHRLHLPAPWLRSYIKSSKHMICSQLVDQCYQDGGVKLFDDGRWPGDVTPADLAGLLEGKVK